MVVWDCTGVIIVSYYAAEVSMASVCSLFSYPLLDEWYIMQCGALSITVIWIMSTVVKNQARNIHSIVKF